MEMEAPGHGRAGTGRRIMLPNSVFLSGTVRIGARPRQFAPHRFTVTLEEPVPVAEALSRLTAAAGAALLPDAERAQRFHKMTAAKAGVEIAGPGPEIGLGTSELGKLQFRVMLYCLAEDATRLEHAVTLAFLGWIHGRAAARPESRGVEDAWTEIGRQLREPRAHSNAA